MNTPTPETDAEFDRLRFIVEPHELGCESQRDVVVFGMRDFARKLERERDEAWKLANTKAEEAGMFRAERDHAIIKYTKQADDAEKQRNVAISKCEEARRERDQLRKVCDMLFDYASFPADNPEACIVHDAYQELPHVKEETK